MSGYLESVMSQSSMIDSMHKGAKAWLVDVGDRTAKDLGALKEVFTVNESDSMMSAFELMLDKKARPRPQPPPIIRCQ